MAKLRLFTSGTHNGMTFSNDEIRDIYNSTVSSNASKIPFVIGHPKNDLPIVGWVDKNRLDLFKEGDKTSIGIERANAEFSEESINMLKKLGNDKISVRLDNMAITHIGLVEKAAVKENNQQTFSENKSGIFCFSEDFQLEVESTKIEEKDTNKIIQFLSNLFKNQNQFNMTQDEKLKAENDALKAKVAEFEKSQNQSATEKENADLKAKIAEFSKKENDAKLNDFKAKVEASKMDADSQKKTLDFAKNCIDKDVKLFEDYVAGVVLEPKIMPKNGNVFAGKTKDFSSEEKPSARDEMQAEFEALKGK